jgi:hypothetical protein
VTELEIVLAVINALEQAAIPYMLVGSFSSNAYGIPRSTKDADFVVQLGQAPLSQLLKFLPPGFRLEAQIGFETITSTTRYRMHYDAANFMIEFFEISEDPHDQARFQRRCQTAAYGTLAFLPTPEDVVVTKLRWSRGGKRFKDLEDVQNVVAVQMGSLDLVYMRRWCDQHGTRDLLEKTLKSVGPVPPGDSPLP